MPGGGAFDGPRGVASALVTLDLLRGSGIRPERPLAIAVFPEEEGSRFGVACLGTRLLTGAIDVVLARSLRDRNGDTFAEVAEKSGFDPAFLGPDSEALARIGTFIELHVEQGRDLIDRHQPVGIGSSILGHGRWRLRVTGQGNHAGTTLMTDRHDPMVAAAAEGCTVELTEESISGTVSFDGTLRDRLSFVLPDAPVQHTGAGHDAGILTRFVPTAMLFVRNPTGVSHSPEEYVENDDAEAGARSLAMVLADLVTHAREETREPSDRTRR